MPLKLEEVATDQNSNTRAFRVPYSLIIPIWTIVVTICGVWWNQDKAQNEQKLQLALVAQNVTGLKTTVSDITSQLNVYSLSSYTVTDAQQRKTIVDKVLADHEARLRQLEMKR